MIHISDYKWSDYTLKTVGYSEGQISIENLRGSFQLSMREIDVQIMANHFGYELVKKGKPEGTETECVLTETEYLNQGKNGDTLRESIAQFERGETKEYVNGELVEVIKPGQESEILDDRSQYGGFMSAESEGDTGD